MAIGGLIKGIGKGLDELEDAFSGASKVDTPKPKTILEEMEESFSFGKAEDDAPLPLPDVEDIELDEFMAELDQIGKPKVEEDPIAELDAILAEFDEADDIPDLNLENPVDQEAAHAAEVHVNVFEIDQGETLDPWLKGYLANFVSNSSEPFHVVAEKMEKIKSITEETGMKALLNFIDENDTLSDAEKLAQKNAELDIAYVQGIEEIDLDAMEITPDRPNLPEGRDFKSLIGNNGPDWVYFRNDDEVEALTLMTHIRGPYFPHVVDDIKAKNYEGNEAAGLTNILPEEEFDKLDPLEVAAVNFYTRAGDAPMNEALREGKYDPNTSLGKAIDLTQRALQNLPSYTPFSADEAVVHRIIRGKAVNEKFGKMEVGDTYTEEAFTSTSLKPNFSVEDGQYNFNMGREGVFFVVKPKDVGSRGHSIEDLSDFRIAEQEVLFEHGTQFKIVEKEVIKDQEPLFGGRMVDVEAIVLYVEEI